LSRAASPPAPGIAYTHSRHIAPDVRRQAARPRVQLRPRCSHEVIPDPAPQMRGIAAHSYLVVNNAHGGRRGIEFAADAMGHPEQRHDRVFDKRHPLRQGIQARGDPCPLRREKPQASALRDAARQDELDPAFGRIDPQSHPPRPLTDPDRDGNSYPGFAIRGEPPAITLQPSTPNSRPEMNLVISDLYVVIPARAGIQGPAAAVTAALDPAFSVAFARVTDNEFI
jgi:hypothetical protein